MAIDQLVKLSDAARELGLSQWTLLRWAKERRLGARKLVNGYWRFSRRAIEEFKQGGVNHDGEVDLDRRRSR